MKIALCLSGGALRAAAHIGAIRYLEEAGVHIGAVSGSSAGAILALFVALGHTSEQMEAFLRSIRKRDLFRFRGSPALFSLEGIERRLREALALEDFSQLRIPTRICVTRIDTARAVYLDRGDPVEAALASGALIPIFAPRKIGEYHYCDGGFADNLPTRALQDLDLPILSINVNPLGGGYPETLGQMILRSMTLAMQGSILEGKRYSTWHLDVMGVERMGLFDFDAIDDAIEAGYTEMRKLWENRPEALQRRGEVL